MDDKWQPWICAQFIVLSFFESYNKSHVQNIAAEGRNKTAVVLCCRKMVTGPASERILTNTYYTNLHIVNSTHSWHQGSRNYLPMEQCCYIYQLMVALATLNTQMMVGRPVEIWCSWYSKIVWYGLSVIHRIAVPKILSSVESGSIHRNPITLRKAKTPEFWPFWVQ